MTITSGFSAIQSYFSSAAVQSQTASATVPATTIQPSPLSYKSDAIQTTTYPINQSVPSSNVSLSSAGNPQAQFSTKDLDPDLMKAMKEGAKIKGVAFGVQYLAAGIALGLGSSSSLLSFVPAFAGKLPQALGITSTLGRVIVIGSVSGAVGAAIGAAKGALDGAIVTYAPNRGTAIAAIAITTGLSNLPMLKVGPTIGWGTVGASTVVGGFYGNFLYDESRKK